MKKDLVDALEPIYHLIRQAIEKGRTSIGYEFDSVLSEQIVQEAINHLVYEDCFNIIDRTGYTVLIDLEVRK